MSDVQAYITQSIAKGLKKPQIKAGLIKTGYTKDQIDNAFYSVEFSQKEFLQTHQRRLLPSKKVLTIIALIFLFFSFIYQFFFYADLQNGCFVKIIPSPTEWNNLTLKRAIRILKYGSPADYKVFCEHINTIDGSVSCGGFEGGCYDQIRGTKSITVSSAQGTVEWTVGVIVHETCHAVQFSQKRGFDEGECHSADDRLLKTIVQI